MASLDLNNNSPQNSKKFMDMVRPGTTNSLKPKTPEKSKTLMRSAVHKPSMQYSHQLRSAGVSKSKVIVPKTYVHSVDADREARAYDAQKNDLISRFSSVATSDQTYGGGSYQNPTNTPVVKPLQAAEPNVDPPTMNIFEQAIDRASAEEQPPLKHIASPRHRRGKRLSIALASVLAVLLIGGFFAYQNSNKLELYAASTKAGFQATAPGYNPVGYKLGSVSSGAGVIEAVYHSKANSASYTISEKSSNWDSPTLLQSYVLTSAAQNYQTVQDSGRTIYLYGPGNATWVSGGIWYIITSHNSLSDKQLVQLAISL